MSLQKLQQRRKADKSLQWTINKMIYLEKPVQYLSHIALCHLRNIDRNVPRPWSPPASQMTTTVKFEGSFIL